MSAGRRRGDMLITTAFDMLIIARAPNLAAGKRGAGGEERGWWLVGRVWHTLERQRRKGAATIVVVLRAAAVPLSNLWLPGNGQ